MKRKIVARLEKDAEYSNFWQVFSGKRWIGSIYQDSENEFKAVDELENQIGTPTTTLLKARDKVVRRIEFYINSLEIKP